MKDEIQTFFARKRVIRVEYEKLFSRIMSCPKKTHQHFELLKREKRLNRISSKLVKRHAVVVRSIKEKFWRTLNEGFAV